MSEKRKPTYAGSIGHSGVQHVKAPLPGDSKGGGTVVKTGEDLRAGK